MDITVKNEYRTEILLSTEELLSYGITYEEMDYGNLETRRALWQMTDDIKRSSGIKISLSGKILIEVIKEGENRVRLCFTSLCRNKSDPKSVKQLIKTGVRPITADFDSFENLLSVCRLLDEECESALYEHGDKLRLLIMPAEEMLFRAECILGEFCDCTDRSEICYYSGLERDRCIISSDAVSNIRRYF